MPVVVPRDPPPLYTWEVLPGLYPPMARPRVPRWRARRPVAAALLAVAVVGAALVGVLVYDGLAATAPGPFVVNGTVVHPVGSTDQPLVGAEVVMTDDAGRSSTQTTGVGGGFSFSGLPPGGVTLNVTAPGFTTVTLTTFVSSIYGTQAEGLEVALAPGSSTNVTTVALAPFPDLEQFLASVGSGAVLLGLIAVVAGAAAVATARADRPALGVVGGAAGAVAPLVLFYLSLSSAFPLLEALSAVVAAAGSFTLAIRAIQLAQTGPAPDFE